MSNICDQLTCIILHVTLLNKFVTLPEMLHFYLDRCYKICILKYLIFLSNLYFKNKCLYCAGTNFNDYLIGLLWTAFIKANTFYLCLVTLLYFTLKPGRIQKTNSLFCTPSCIVFFLIYRLVNIKSYK